MKYRLESLELEAIDTYVRVTLHNVNGVVGKTRCLCTKKECPTAEQVWQTVLDLYQDTYGYTPTLNDTQLANCSRAAKDAKDNKAAWEIQL